MISVLFFLFVSYPVFHPALHAGEADSLLGMIDQQKVSTEKVDNLLRLAFLYRSVDKDSALMFTDRASELSRILDYKKGIAESSYRKSMIYRYLGEMVLSIKYADTFLKLSADLSDSSMIAKASYNLALIFTIQGDPQRSIQYYRMAKAAYKAENNLRNLLAVYNGMGNMFSNIAFYDSAAIYFHKAIELNNQVGDNRRKAIALSNLGGVYINLGNYEQAKLYLGESIDLCFQNTDNSLLSNLANSYSRMGSIYFESEEYANALDYYRLADSVYSLTNNQRGQNNVQVNTAHIYANMNKFNLALLSYTSALNYYREQDMADGMIVAMQGMAGNYAKRGFNQESIMYYDSSLMLAREAGYLQRQMEVLQNIYFFYDNIGDYKSALAYHEALLDIKDSILNENTAFTVNDLMFKYDTKQKELDIVKQKNEKLRFKKQRDSFIYTVFGIVILALYLIIFFRTKQRKDKIINEQRIRQLEEEKKLLAARFLVEGQEKERKRIASAIHDSLGVLLSASKMHVTAIKDSSPENKALIDKATKFLDDASGEMRKISHNMMPGLLTKMGLFEALEDLFENINDTENIDAVVDVVGPKSERLPENHEIMIYRIVQEMVNNTLKHAEAGKIDLVMMMHPDQLVINYSDNGLGFDVEKVIEQKSLGIQSIHSRVSFLDGKINIKSTRGKGSLYTITIPVDSKDS